MVEELVPVIRNINERGCECSPDGTKYSSNPPGRDIEYNYNIEGKSELKLNGQAYFLEAGDSSAFNAPLEHSVTALEKLKFFGIFVEDRE